jgi:preprotein translocase subunit Sec61beta
MESKLKLSPLTVIVIGIALSLIAVGFGLRSFLPNTT